MKMQLSFIYHELYHYLIIMEKSKGVYILPQNNADIFRKSILFYGFSRKNRHFSVLGIIHIRSDIPTSKWIHFYKEGGLLIGRPP